MGIYHEWNGTVLTVTSDSGTSSADLKGEKGDTGIRGPQGKAGILLVDEEIIRHIDETIEDKMSNILDDVLEALPKAEEAVF